MPELVLKGLEHVYDAFDEYEHPNHISLRVTGLSVSEAITRGRSLLQSMVTRQRREGGFLSSGTFSAELTRIEDSEGYILYQDLKPVREGLRYFGDDLEDYRDAVAEFVFLSYSHRDARFTEQIAKQLEIRGLRLWFDRNDIQTESSLLRFGNSEDEDSRLLRVLEHAIDRAKWLLLVVSSNSIDSKWVKAEVAFSVREDVPIACLLLERSNIAAAPAWVSAAASNSHCYDFSGWDQGGSWNRPLKKLLEDVFRYRGHD
ncbi:hypothetical protein EPICR_60115 [Candidatus Desulfarcum epimagneticum]|uniref:TIR domain-containing protein n=1 Tax=uncultured Desulfobacteraceae bacterium TaxID=218296 RepID=A0A484HNH6_9BACT|nr:hypothetical protein EPICR_60115 [uncultured Desulfobacteraceae bacterium]